jgi:HopA1 effector protein family
MPDFKKFLINYSPTSLMSNSQQTLVEIVENIQIDEKFTVCHPDYPPIELRSDLVTSFQHLPPQLQLKYLTTQVQNYLYDIYFSHSLRSLAELEIAAQQPTLIRNNLLNGIDVDFCQRLDRANPGHGYIDPDWQIVAETPDRELIVVKDGLHLHIDRQQHLPKEFRSAAIGDPISIYLPHNLADRDTYIAVGNSGTPDRAESVQLYFNFTPAAAIEISEQIARTLNRVGIPFQFAILHDPAMFYRYDAGTLWLPQSGYLAAQGDLAQIYRSHRAEFSPQVPLLTKQLALGLGLAEVPINASFGMQRCEIIATGLLAAIDRDRLLASDKLDLVRQELTLNGIDWQQPHLNSIESDPYIAYVTQ